MGSSSCKGTASAFSLKGVSITSHQPRWDPQHMQAGHPRPLLGSARPPRWSPGSTAQTSIHHGSQNSCPSGSGSNESPKWPLPGPASKSEGRKVSLELSELTQDPQRETLRGTRYQLVEGPGAGRTVMGTPCPRPVPHPANRTSGSGGFRTPPKIV